MRSLLRLITSLTILLIIFSPICLCAPLVNDERITFQPNSLPFLNVYLDESSFVFEWGTYFIRLKPYVVVGGEYRDFASFVKSIKLISPDVEHKWILEKGNYSVHYGFEFLSLPSVITNNLNFIGFNFIDLNFSISEIEIETLFVARDEFGDPISVPYNLTRIHIPRANLEFSFEDLIPLDYSVMHLNKTSVRIGNVTGKADLLIDPITFSNGLITISGFPDTNEDIISDIYDADKNGELTLYSGSVGTDITLSQQIQPSDELALKINLTLSSSDAGKNDHIDMTGTDAWGESLFEEVLTEGDGEFQTLERFRTITDIDCIGFSSGTLVIKQYQWGVVWKNTEYSYRFDARLKETSGWFIDSKKQILFSAQCITTNYQKLIHIKNWGTSIRLGVLSDEADKSTYGGCQITTLDTYATTYMIYCEDVPDYVHIYSCDFASPISKGWFDVETGESRFWNCHLSNGMGFYWNSPSIYNMVIEHVGTVFDIAGGTFDDLYITGCVRVARLLADDPITIKNLFARDITHIARAQVISVDSTFINTDSDCWAVDWFGVSTGKIWRKYDYTLTVTYLNGSAIENAHVIIMHYGEGGGTDFDDYTDSNGQISTTLSMGYYDYAGGSVLNDYNPFNINITFGESWMYEGNFSLDSEQDLTIILYDPLKPSDYAIWFIGLVVIASIVSFSLVLSMKWRKEK